MHACASQGVVSASRVLNPVSLNPSTLHDAPPTPSPSPGRSTSRSTSHSSSRSSSPSSSEDDSEPFMKPYVPVLPTYSPSQLCHHNALDLAAQKFAEVITAEVKPPTIASVYASVRIQTRNCNAGSTAQHPPVASSSMLTPAGPLSDEEIWWVVLRGDSPGVYHGRSVFCPHSFDFYTNYLLPPRTVAQRNTGTSGQVWVKKAGSYDQACHMFSAAIMNHDVFQYF